MFFFIKRCSWTFLEWSTLRPHRQQTWVLHVCLSKMPSDHNTWQYSVWHWSFNILTTYHPFNCSISGCGFRSQSCMFLKSRTLKSHNSCKQKLGAALFLHMGSLLIGNGWKKNWYPPEFINTAYLKRWQRPVMFIISLPQLWWDKMRKKSIEMNFC